VRELSEPTHTPSPPEAAEPVPAAPSKRWRRRIFLAALAVIALSGSGCLIAYLLWPPYHFLTVEPGVLYRSGQLGPRALEQVCREARIRTIVDLVGEKRDRSEVQNEVEFSRKNGIQYLHLPLPGAAVGIEDHVNRFLSVLDDPRNRPVLVHCWQGVTRTGIMVAVFRMEYQGVENREALEGLHAFGKTVEQFKPTERDFILNYVPRSKRRAAEAGASAPESSRP
jgi:tyrosine-protein phosphatase SIW14